MKIALVVGHRKGSQGAYGNSGISEYKFWDEFLKENILDFSDNHKYKIFYRSDDVKGYTERMKHLHKRIDKWGAKVSVSFHFNGSSNPYVHGHEVLYHSKGGKHYAKKLDHAFDNNMGNNDRGIKHRGKHQRGGGFLARGRSYCILSEAFFGYEQDQYITGEEARGDLVASFIEFFERI